MRHYSPVFKRCYALSLSLPRHLSQKLHMKKELLIAILIGIVLAASVTIMIASLGTHPPAKASTSKGDKLKDIGPRTVSVQRVKHVPIPLIKPTPWEQPMWLQVSWFELPSYIIWPTMGSPPVKVAVQPDKPDKVEDVCTRHKMRKVWINKRSWRCRK
jgi:hypothetical protein